MNSGVQSAISSSRRSVIDPPELSLFARRFADPAAAEHTGQRVARLVEHACLAPGDPVLALMQPDVDFAIPRHERRGLRLLRGAHARPDCEPLVWQTV